MKKLLALLAAMAFLSASACQLFRTEVKYSVSGSSDAVTVRYNARSGEIADATTPSPWEESFDLYSGDKPFLAFMRVTNNGAGTIQAGIYENSREALVPVSVAAGATVDLYTIIE